MRSEAVSTGIGTVYLLIGSAQVLGATLSDETVFSFLDGEPVLMTDKAGLLLAMLAIGDNDRWCAMTADAQVAAFRTAFEV